MYCTRKVTDDLTWVGADDRRLACFEGVYGVPDGVSYNSYLLIDDKTVLFDTVDKAVSRTFFENVAHALGGRKLDYLVISHMEPDHAATIDELTLRHPEVTIVCNDKIKTMLGQFFSLSDTLKYHIVKEGDTLSTGKHNFTFVMAPMVHWPEVMMTYDLTDKMLFSADAFGTFGALNGHLFNDEVDFFTDYLDEARRYYTNIVGKYGVQVQALLKKAATLDIRMICPLHGPVWRKDIAWFLDKYIHWATYTPEDDAVVIAYASVYGGTESAANVVASRLSEGGVRNVRVYDVSKTHVSELIGEAFRCSTIVLASITYNMDIFTPMKNLLTDLAAHNVQGRRVALIENGSWSPVAASLMEERLAQITQEERGTAALHTQLREKEARLAELQSRIETMKADLAACSAKRLELEGMRTKADRQAQERNRDLLDMQGLVSRFEQKKLAADMEEKQILDKLWENYELSHSAAEALRQPVENLPKAQKQISDLRRQISALGNPNIGAIEEFDRVNTRYEFLSTQRDDVEKAKGELLTVIKDLTGQMEQLFVERFHEIDQCFRQTFLELFGGGKAALKLEDENNVLDCGIDIRIQGCRIGSRAHDIHKGLHHPGHQGTRIRIIPVGTAHALVVAP